MTGGSPPARPALKRELGLLQVTAAGVGIILGAGIYALIGEAAGLAGNAVWLAFGFSAVVALLTCFSYAELSSMYPRAAAEYEYTRQGFGPEAAFLIGWLIIFSGVVGAATVAIAFSGYFQALFPMPAFLPGVGIILVLAAILLYGIRETAWLAISFTIVEAGGLVAIIIAGIPFLGSIDYLEMPLGVQGLFSAAALVFFAFMGFEEMVKFADETRKPATVIPRALMLAIGICIVLYVLVSISAVSVVGWEALSASDAPFVTVAGAAWGADASVVISVVALFATSNTVLLMLLAASQITYGMASAGSLPEQIAFVHPGRRTPWVAVLGVSVAAICFTVPGDLGMVANVTNFLLFVTFLVINATVIVLRYRSPGLERPFRIPLAIGRLPVLPVLGILSSVFMIAQLTLPVIALGVGIIVIGVLIAYFFKKKGAVTG
ncbi:APA family basic amino acid/polyamine antiporter [Methanolinea mesophila]|uniref:APC family permease n=1 Tax=Methanolinea mesophila TaxID=547055 RepID=UPI001AE2EA2B|nr:amino acid permease [Methanolinea mesophila]MBP1928225.1 APA family basic amino acid/polyamine antiporter [Methanolinea mesophila]